MASTLSADRLESCQKFVESVFLKAGAERVISIDIDFQWRSCEDEQSLVPKISIKLK